MHEIRIMPLVTFSRWILGLGLLLLSGPACDSLKDEDPDIVVTFTEFTVDLYQQRHPGTGVPVFGLWIESLKTFDCSNFRIEAVTEITPGAIAVRLKEINAPDTCRGNPGPARGFLPIGALADGTYPFTLQLNPAIVNKGTLIVENGRYTLDLPEPLGVDFQNRILEPFPAGDFVWGYALTPVEADQPVADQFIQTLKPLTVEPGLAPGYYGDFTVSGAGQYFFHRSIKPGGEYRAFLRRLVGQPDALRQVLQTYRNSPVRPLTIRCLSTLGEW